MNPDIIARSIRIAAGKGDVRGLVESAVALQKLKQVLSGGVSDRTEKLGDGISVLSQATNLLEAMEQKMIESQKTVTTYDGQATVIVDISKPD